MRVRHGSCRSLAAAAPGIHRGQGLHQVECLERRHPIALEKGERGAQAGGIVAAVDRTRGEPHRQRIGLERNAVAQLMHCLPRGLRLAQGQLAVPEQRASRLEFGMQQPVGKGFGQRDP